MRTSDRDRKTDGVVYGINTNTTNTKKTRYHKKPSFRKANLCEFVNTSINLPKELVLECKSKGICISAVCRLLLAEYLRCDDSISVEKGISKIVGYKKAIRDFRPLYRKVIIEKSANKFLETTFAKRIEGIMERFGVDRATVVSALEKGGAD